MHTRSMETNYIEPLTKLGIEPSSCIGFNVKYNDAGKCPAKLMDAHIKSLLPALVSVGSKTLLVCDGSYFKKLTKAKKVDPNYGSVLPCAIKGYEGISVVLCANYQAIFHNPLAQEKIDMALATLASHINGTYVAIGTDIIKSEEYPVGYTAIKEALTKLLDYPSLTCDIEAFSLKHYSAGVGTIEFAWDEGSGIAFSLDYVAHPNYNCFAYKGKQIDNTELKQLLKWFFCNYKGNMKYHNAAYDVKVLIYELFMDDITDHVGLQEGLAVMTRDFDCTKLIAYLATNTCAGNHLSLKELAHEFAGNYGQEDINDIRLIGEEGLLRYNLVDGLATWYVFHKYYPIMVADCQEELYLGLMKESLITIIQMELTGMPMSMKHVAAARRELTEIALSHSTVIDKSPVVRLTIAKIQSAWLIKDYASRKESAVNPEKIMPRSHDEIMVKPPQAYPMTFNPGSGTQLAIMLHEVMGLPIIETTATGLPACDDDTLKALMNHTDNQDYIDLIGHIRGLGKVGKILGTFIPAFEQAQLGKDGIYYLFGSFNLGGTKSGRLSSSSPNLQNIPSGSTYAKLIKKCFRGNSEWLYAGADFASLEDYISALTTRDPNKIKVYVDKYDGHCLRAYGYFGDQMPDIVNTVEGINSIKSVYPKFRKKSKSPTFLLTYGGTYHGLKKNLGFAEEEAKRIEANYHKLYAVSDAWVADKIKIASKVGYVEVAFGLRLRTPILKKTILGARSTPYEAAAEGRTAGNALGQSYGLLNNRAGNEFMKRVRLSTYRYDIKICAMIHDAIYLLVRNHVDVVHWANKNLTECMAWQELPELQHDTVKLHAELDLYVPCWKDATTLPADATKEYILNACK